jgi:cell wall-associated NlpC family hydrolase
VVGVLRRRGPVVRGMIPVALVALAGTLLAPGAVAQPPTTVAGLLAHYYDLSHEAEKVNEDLLRSQEDLGKKRDVAATAAAKADAAKATADAARAKAKTARDDMDLVTALSAGRQAQSGMSALVSGASPDDVLNHVEAASLADQVSGRITEVGSAVVAEADRAAAEATKASDAAHKVESEVSTAADQLASRKGELDRQIAEVRSALDHLTPEQRSLLSATEFTGSDVKIPAGDVGAVLKFALSQIGKPYLWGAVGPASYDCSGLVQTSFRVGGVEMPRVSFDQATVGIPVLRHEVRAGDLIFFYNPVHHVAIAVDNMRAVHAPSFGETVKLALIDEIGPITVIRRVMK